MKKKEEKYLHWSGAEKCNVHFKPYETVTELQNVTFPQCLKNIKKSLKTLKNVDEELEAILKKSVTKKHSLVSIQYPLVIKHEREEIINGKRCIKEEDVVLNVSLGTVEALTPKDDIVQFQRNQLAEILKSGQLDAMIQLTEEMM